MLFYFIETVEDGQWHWRLYWNGVKCAEQIQLVCCRSRLMLAASNGKLATVQELRRLGASYEVCDKSGSTALHWASLSKNPQLVDWMLQDGADVSATNDLGRTPLMLLGVKMLYFPIRSKLDNCVILLSETHCSTSLAQLCGELHHRSQ